ncbi:hypothetical protein OSH11_11670 [Kaistia dalseonensis]|uniref:Bacteriophage protein n=1 Tax=Kaistia dalseonensis TaxID=410840 RepID=A0ABU0H8X8_9HYPH|nr:hypothetical protein [Kaistia dalseonensis]MCX5495368.1 hypothetical protein [Kaistia dalseonensis]MDQ0437954.1 hypothetical protein [Kaistia dalseonensis]
MAEFEVAGVQYNSRKMDAFQQFHVARKLAPAVAPFMKAIGPMLVASQAAETQPAALVESLLPLMQAISDMPADDCDFIVQSCLSVVSRKQAGGGGWAPVWNKDAKVFMFDDIDMTAMLAIAAQVIRENVGSFSRALPSVLSTAGR